MKREGKESGDNFSLSLLQHCLCPFTFSRLHSPPLSPQSLLLSFLPHPPLSLSLLPSLPLFLLLSALPLLSVSSLPLPFLPQSLILSFLHPSLPLSLIFSFAYYLFPLLSLPPSFIPSHALPSLSPLPPSLLSCHPPSLPSSSPPLFPPLSLPFHPPPSLPLVLLHIEKYIPRQISIHLRNNISASSGSAESLKLRLLLTTLRNID